MNGLASVGKLKKEVSAQGMYPIAQVAAAALALKGINYIGNKISDARDKQKFHEVIGYADKKHPELKRVPYQQKLDWMDAFHTLSPKAATNKELGSSMLLTANEYGGNIDLATAKMIGSINSSGKSGGHDDLMSFISGGRSLVGKDKKK